MINNKNQYKKVKWNTDIILKDANLLERCQRIVFSKFIDKQQDGNDVNTQWNIIKSVIISVPRKQSAKSALPMVMSGTMNNANQRFR